MKKMMISVMVALLLAGCASISTKDIQIEAQADPKADLSGYKSYAWLGSAAMLSDAYGQWVPPGFDADSEIKYLIDRELRERGMLQTSTDPDLMIGFAAGINMDALGLKENPDSSTSYLVNMPQGGLLIAGVDSDSGFVVWAGIAIGDAQEQPDAERAKGRLDYAVTELFKKLPK
jgi:hypothetical protein